MKIIIPRVTGQTTKTTIRDFFERGFDGMIRLPFSEKPRLVSCELLKITDRNGVSEIHGLVQVTPEKQAKRLIRRLQGKRLDGKPVIVREYFTRRSEQPLDSGSERRRSDLTMTKLSMPKAQGLTQFAHEHYG